ncbi:type II methionyl aminopeptidase [Candidatus Woesearchaeota archaeon]|nr:type II methionyl aminopeptidase [Candidatus Woesearchaeota archaeon]
MDDDFKKNALAAGKLAGEALLYGKTLIKPDVKIVDILDSVESFIQEKGGFPAFPSQISVNTIAAHQCSALDDDSIVKESDVIKLDVGVHINGYIGDNALTVNLNNEYKELVEASKKALKNVSTMFTPGTPVGEIGGVIQDTIIDMGFSPVKNLSGHGLGYFNIHTCPSIPNVRLDNSNVLEENMHVACEPFATNGKGAIAEGGSPTVFTLQVPRPVRSPIAREVLQKIKTYDGLPFASRWLEREFGAGKTRLALMELQKNGSLIAHPPLREIGKGMVSQHEHSFIVGDKPIITTKIDDE